MLSNNDIGLPVIRANNINEGYLNMETDIKYWYEKDPQGADINNYLVSKGDILINFINSEAKMGTATVVQKVLNRKTIYTTNILKARVDENYDKYFWFTLTLTDKYKNDIKIITKPAVNQASFTTVDFKKLSYLFPNLKEQQKIGNYFSNLDRLITLHQRKILLYKYFLTIVWEQRKLGDCTFLSGKKNKNNLNLEPYAITNEHGFIPQNKAHDEFGYMKDTDRRAYNIVSKNSFAYNPARINIGSIGYYKGTENVIISSLYEVFQTVDSVYDPFLWQWFKTKDFQNWIIRLQEGSVRLYFYYDKLCECIIRMPKLEEQIKIANYFEALDNLITLHQWECIISRKNMVNAWEQRKLGEIGSASSGVGFPNSEQGGKEGIPFYKVSDMNLEGNEIEMTVSNNYVTKEQIARKKWSPLNDVPAMYFAKVGAAVMLNRKRLCRFPFLFDNNTMAYSLNKEYWDINFAKAEFAKIDLTKLVQVGALPSYNANDVESIKIMIPSLFEQSKIGNYFDELDRLITLHQWECIVCTKIKVNTSIQCKFIKIGVKLQKCILLSIILLFEPRNIRFVFYVNILLRFIKVIELEVELIFVIIDGTIMFYLKIRCLYLNIFYTFIFKINK